MVEEKDSDVAVDGLKLVKKRSASTPKIDRPSVVGVTMAKKKYSVSAGWTFLLFLGRRKEERKMLKKK
jgi:hypothetical protein